MIELISGKEAMIAWDNKIPLEYTSDDLGEWFDVNNSNTLGIFERSDFKFRIKTRTIMINNIEVPAPFEPKDGEEYWYITDCVDGYGSVDNKPCARVGIAAWRSEGEIKQVVAALRKVFKGE